MARRELAERLDVTVRPGARKTELLAYEDGRAAIAVAAKPEDGKANQELIRYLKRLTGHDYRITRGATGRKKTLRR